jgi:hypothetical protein
MDQGGAISGLFDGTGMIHRWIIRFAILEECKKKVHGF